MSILALAYPKISKEDYCWIQQLRKNHDELYYQVVDPHFTLVFPTFNRSEEEFTTEIANKSANFGQIDFTIRCAVIDKDAFNEYWHVFLVPDQGFSSIIKLHDQLYSENLLDSLLLEIPFIPHIGIGNSKDKWECKKLIDEINRNNINITGVIDSIDIIRFENNKVEKIKKIIL